MNRKVRLYAAVSLLALFVAGCSGPCESIKAINAPAPGSGTADFTRYVAIGTSIGAGTESDGLVYRHQLHAYAQVFARQIRMSPFTYPAIGDSGLPALLRLVSLAPSPVIVRGTHPGQPTNSSQATAYDNLCIPGAILADVADSSLYVRSPIFAIILRHRGTVLQQAASLAPTFVSFEFGANEVLGPATQGSGDPLVPPGTWAAGLHATLDALQGVLPASTKLALFNVPNVTTIPFVTTIKPYVVGPGGVHIALLGTSGPLSESDYVLLSAGALIAAGTGLPVGVGNGNGDPLPDAVVLTASEAASLVTAIDAYNAAIATEATARGAALVDLHGLLVTAASTGVVIGGVRYSSAFLTGGLFSLDGFHPSDLGSGLIANRMIDAVNAKFGASIQRADISTLATHSVSGARPTLEEGGAQMPVVQGLEDGLQSLYHGR